MTYKVPPTGQVLRSPRGPKFGLCDGPREGKDGVALAMLAPDLAATVALVAASDGALPDHA